MSFFPYLQFYDLCDEFGIMVQQDFPLAGCGFSPKDGSWDWLTTPVAGGVSVAVSLVYATRGGINVLDTVDHFINNFGIAVVGFVEVAMVAWILRNLVELRGHANEVSDIHLGSWWRVALTTVTPVLLGVMLVDNLRTELATQYGEYPAWFNGVFGWGVAGLLVVIALLASRGGWAVLDEPLPATARSRDAVGLDR